MLLELNKVSKRYGDLETGCLALDTLSLSMAAGEFTVLCGPSGSGKTTLLNVVGTLDQPSSGDIILNGQSLSGRSSREQAALRCEAIGFIFQTYNLLPILTVYENVALPLQLLKRDSVSDIRDKVMAILTAVGLDGMQGRWPSQLSGGQQQRVSIARALVKVPQLVLADEPTANLDSQTGLEMISLLKSLNAQEKTTFLISTHDRAVMDHSHRLITLKDGVIASDRTSKRGA